MTRIPGMTITQQVNEMLVEPGALREIIEALRYHAQEKIKGDEQYHMLHNHLDRAYHAALRLTD